MSRTNKLDAVSVLQDIVKLRYEDFILKYEPKNKLALMDKHRSDEYAQMRTMLRAIRFIPGAKKKVLDAMNKDERWLRMMEQLDGART